MTTSLRASTLTRGRDTRSSGDLSWSERWAAAACVSVGPEMFFPDPSDHALAARSLCRRCPLRDECLAEAMGMEAGRSTQFRHGIWGGMTPLQRWELDRAQRGEVA